MNAPDRLADLRVNPAWAKLPLFDRSKWQRVRFGDVVRVLKEQVDPNSGEVDRYVAGEHMDSESIHIRRWGTVGDGYLGPAFHRRFRKGQVLYGSRRTYLKKVTVAEWDGVTANTTFVLETMPEHLLQELLPWLMLSNRFTEHSIAESKGSTNPYINWPDIAKFEFDLPPVEQQRRIVEVASTCEENLQAATRLFDDAALAKAVLMDRETQYAHATGRPYGKQQLADVISLCQYGMSLPLASSGAYPVLRMMNYDEELVAHTEMAYVNVEVNVAKEFRVEQGDILFNRTNSADLVGKVGIFDLDGDYLFASYLVRVRVNRDLMIPEFLNFFLNSVSGQRTIRAFATPGVSQSNISAGNLKKVRVPVPPLREQEVIVQSLLSAAASARQARAHVERTREQLLALTNALCMGAR